MAPLLQISRGSMVSESALCSLLRNLSDPSFNSNETSFLDVDEGTGSVSTVNRITYGYITPVIIIVGIIGDILTVYTLTHPALRRTSIIYTYLTLLAMTDFLSQLSVVPMILWLLEIRLCSPIAGFYYAHVGFPLVNALMGSSVFIVVFLTLSQYMAVCRPFAYGMRSRKICFALFAVAYVFNFCIYAPWALKKQMYEIPLAYQRDHICPYVVCDVAPEPAWFEAYAVVREVLCRGLPFVVIAFLNGSILYTYRSTKSERMKRLTNSQKRFATEKSEKEEKRLFTLLFTICIIFFICTIPAAPLTLLVTDDKGNNLPFQVFRAIVNVLEFTKFALNFYFYCLINPEIRSICAHIITCKKLHRPARVKGQPVTPISLYTKSVKEASKPKHPSVTARSTSAPGGLQQSTKSRDVAVNGAESRRSSTERRNSSSFKGRVKKAVCDTNGAVRDRTHTVIQADIAADKLTVIRESDDTDEIGERI